MNAIKLCSSTSDILQVARQFRSPCVVARHKQTHQIGVAVADATVDNLELSNEWQVIAYLGANYPEWLGDQHFLHVHGARFPYVVGEMANGIATADMVIAAVKAGFVGFFGAAGLVPSIVEQNILKIKNAIDAKQINWGANLIHSPNEPTIEAKVVELYIQHEVTRVSASAYMKLSPHLVHYAAKGLHTDSNGNIIRRNHVLAKISRPEVADPFMRPAPEKILKQLLAENKITQQEAELALQIPVAEDITVESDSGGHTDNRPLAALFPRIFELTQQINRDYQYPEPIRVGAAGSIGTPAAVASAFAMGAAYVLTGTINQAAIESGLSPAGREMLLTADIADVAMAPAADMFELGVKLQVIKRGTMFANRAKKLYDVYTTYKSIEDIPEKTRQQLESQIFKRSLADVWQDTKAFFTERDPEQITKADQDSHYQMALIFRWYLGLSSIWAIKGDAERLQDYQIWCGPAMGAFNSWVKGSFLEQAENRTTEQIGKNLLEGATYINRLRQLAMLGVPIPASAYHFSPRPLA